jgi:hypothetical protein
MTRHGVLQFMRRQSLGVQASVTVENRPQAAVVGFVVTDAFEIVFDTLATSRKAVNFTKNPDCAFVIGGLRDGNERSVQYEGTADLPTGTELDALKELYFARFPDGRERQHWPGLIYVRVKPRWLRYNDWNQSPPIIVEFAFNKENQGTQQGRD